MIKSKIISISISRNEKGERHGTCIEHWSNGRLRYNIQYQNGFLHGRITEFHNDGTLWYYGYHLNGKIIGYEITIKPNIINRIYYII